MARPKSSFAGLGTFAVTAINNRKLTKMKNDFERINQQNNDNMEIVSQHLKTIRDLHIATLAGICDLNIQLTELSRSSWEILDFLKDIDRREEILGDLKLFLINVEDEVEKIHSLSKEYPEYALLLAENLNMLMENKGVKLDHFKRMPSTSDIKWAKSVLESVETTLVQVKKQVMR